MSGALIEPAAAEAGTPCRTCGACCAGARDWPRFTTEDDTALDRLPPEFINDEMTGMRCDGDRCVALVGQIGITTSCAVYFDRPDVCRACEPGDEACQMARRKHGLPMIRDRLGTAT